MSTLQIEPQTYLGTWRRFGPTGPVYEIVESPAITETATA